MSRRQGILSTRAQMQRDAARQHTAHLRAETQAMRTALQAQRAYERSICRTKGTDSALRRVPYC